MIKDNENTKTNNTLIITIILVILLVAGGSIFFLFQDYNIQHSIGNAKRRFNYSLKGVIDNYESVYIVTISDVIVVYR